MEDKDLTYKEAYERLQEIQGMIESKQMDIDDLTNVLKEATTLLKVCKDKLFAVEQETHKILKDIE